ncbi:uncharacterized protein [Clytia hemisphaerica]|uniref:ETS domain-containing protein n=1 Tax=Clytia hemisphaerica TaxID=252671 RepID=A0A7M5VDT1_9CNID
MKGFDDALNFPEIKTEIKTECEINQPTQPEPSSMLALATLKVDPVADDTSEDHKQDITAIKNSTEDLETEDLKNEKNDKLCRLYLWYFLLELLGIEGTENIISWTNKETLEFKIHDAKRLAVMWGNMHGRENMTYAKFSRALRYHYKKGVLQKVHKKRYCYQFLRCAKVKYVMEENATKNKVKFNAKVKQEVISNNKANEAKKQQKATNGSTNITKKSISKTDSTPQFLELPRPESRTSFSSDETSSHTSELPEDFEMEDVSTMDLNIAEYLTSGDLTRDVPDIRVQDLVEEMQASDQMIMNNTSPSTSCIDQNSYTFYQESQPQSRYISFYQQTYQQNVPDNQQQLSTTTSSYMQHMRQQQQQEPVMESTFLRQPSTTSGYMQQMRQQQQEQQQPTMESTFLSQQQQQRSEMESTFLQQQQQPTIPDLSTQISSLDYMSSCALPSFGLDNSNLTTPSIFNPFSSVDTPTTCGTGINLNQNSLSSIDLSFISESMNLYNN